MTDAKITVKVDPDLEELIPGFLENRRKDIVGLRDAVARGDVKSLQSTGHSLKGVGGGYGFDGLSEIGAKIEAAAKTGDVNAIGPLVESLADYMDRVEVVFE